MESQKEMYFSQIEKLRSTQETLEEENRDLSRKLLSVTSHEEMLEGKSKTLEEKLTAIQDRYEIRFKAQEDEIQKLRKENMTFRHENELGKVEMSDLLFRVNRSEYNEKILQQRLSKTNEDYSTPLSRVEVYDTKIAGLRQEINTVSLEKDDAETLLQGKVIKLKIAEERIKSLEEELKDKNTECQNRIRAYERMKRENDECKKKTEDAERKLTRVKIDTVKKLKSEIGSKKQDIKIFKQKVKGSEIQLSTKDKEIKFLQSKIKRLERILKVHMYVLANSKLIYLMINTG
jgi:chromosome segregation ATPase